MKISPNYCRVTQRIIAITADSDQDEDRLPDQQTVSGEVFFTPNVAKGRAYQLRDEEGNFFTVPLGRVEASIVDGEIVHEGQPGISLFAAGQGSNPDKISYYVEYRNLRAGETAISLSPINFEAVPGGEVDLTAATPVTGATPAGTTKGDKGDPFLYEDFTPEQLEALKGDPFTYNDFTPEQLADLKGEKGDPGDLTSDQLIDTSFGTRLMLGDTLVHGDTGIVDVVRWDTRGNVVRGKAPEGVAPQEGIPGFITLRRITNDVTLEMSGVVLENSVAYFELDEGYRNQAYMTPFQTVPANMSTTDTETGVSITFEDAFVYGMGWMVILAANKPGTAIPGAPNISARATWHTVDPWPSPPSNTSA